MSNSRELAKAAYEPLAVFAAGLDETWSKAPETWSPSLVDDMVADLMANLLHYSATHGRRNAEATLALVQKFYADEHPAHE